MAPRWPTHTLKLARGRSHEARSFLAQLDDQSRRMLADLKGITAAELQWQPKPGQNTIGMLLAHIAVVEVYWLQAAMQDISEPKLVKVLGMGFDDGLPLPPNGLPPAELLGRTFAYYSKLLAKARKNSHAILRIWSDADFERMVWRTRRNGDRSRQSLRWIVYHMLEHLAGHYGQILLMRHQYRNRKQK